MIYFDRTKAAGAKHRSGLMRVSARLAEEWGADVTPVRWGEWDRSVRAGDWFLTTELFSESERPGIARFVAEHSCRLAAIFHDAIPLRFPHITWPQSVARHPAYMKLLAEFDRVWAVSAASKRDLEGFWRWQGLARTPPVDVIELGADFVRTPRVDGRAATKAGRPKLLCLGILEPRKNQPFLFEVCERLWREGLDFELHVVGRVNPHFGAPIVARAKELERRYRGRFTFHGAIDDRAMARLLADARATVFPTIAEGCGLPLLESLWMGLPCVCTDLPVLREQADAGGCIPVSPNDHEAWMAALRKIVTDDPWVARLTAEAAVRPLPTWAAAAAAMRHGLQQDSDAAIA